jgi:aromatic-L-amino-acid decarboxylase
MTDLDPEEFRRQAHAVVDWIADYRAGLAQRPIGPTVGPGWVRAQLPAELPERPAPVTGLLADLDRVVLPASTHWQHPGFFGYFPANASLPSLLGDMLSAGLGAQGMLWSTSPAATEVEQVLLDGFAAALGLGPEFTFPGGGGGCIQDSASSAALVALLAALHRTSGGAWRNTGVDGRERVYLTAETHSSVAKAARVAGLGSRALCVVDPSPGGLDMSPDGLAAALAADRAAGLRPTLVCATVGSTGTGACDRLRELAGAVQPHHDEPPPWLHVDAAWAGVAALCPEHRGLLDGVALADSFCTDAHKWLLTAFDASLFWVRDGHALPAALSITPEYLRNAASESGAVVDYRDWQVPLGRRFRALKLWAVVHAFGLDGLRSHIRSHVAMAERLAGWVRADPRFTLAAAPSLALLCLRLATSAGPDADDAATRALLTRINATGRALLTHTVVHGRYAIRVAIGSVATRPGDVASLWAQLRAGATAVLADSRDVG